MKIYYDGHCQICIHFASFLRKIDWFNQLQLVSFRTLADYPDAMENEIHVYMKNKTHIGYRAIIAIAKKLPLLWLALPMLYLFQWINIGDLLYKRFARIRNHLLKNSCHDECFR